MQEKVELVRQNLDMLHKRTSQYQDAVHAVSTTLNAMFSNVCRASARLMSTSAQSSVKASTAPYPFSKTALTPPPMLGVSPALRKGKGLMQHIQQNLFTPEKQDMMKKLFSRKSPTQLRIGSIVSVVSGHAPTVFNGVLIAIRRRGPDSSIRVRNVLNRTGIEVQFFVNSPGIKEINMVRPPPKGRMRRAKLFYLRDSSDKMSLLAGKK